MICGSGSRCVVPAGGLMQESPILPYFGRVSFSKLGIPLAGDGLIRTAAES